MQREEFVRVDQFNVYRVIPGLRPQGLERNKKQGKIVKYISENMTARYIRRMKKRKYK